jgi:hypothetical protein
MRVHYNERDKAPITVDLVKDDVVAVIFEVKIGRLRLAIGCSLETFIPFRHDICRKSLVEALAANTTEVARHFDLDVTASDGWVRISQGRGFMTTDNYTLSRFSLQLRADEWRMILDLMKALLLPK